MGKQNFSLGVPLHIRKRAFWGYAVIFFVYLFTRILAWQKTSLLEDYDSIFLMLDAKAFLSWNLQNVISLRPDATPLYPFFSALLSLPGWSIEFAARLCSLLFSIGLFWAIVALGHIVAPPRAIMVGLLILTFSPVLIPLSYSVLTEPSYLAVVYFGLWGFIAQHKILKFKSAIWLGCIFGLSFLSRTEGLFYLLVIPLLQTGHYFFVNPKPYPFKKLCIWVVIYSLFFAMVVSLQIWRVSHQMGYFAINGRQVWTLILKNPDQKSYEERIYGLDHSPAEVNLHYIQSDADVIRKFESNLEIKSFIQNSLNEFNELYQKNLGILIGPFGIAFFAIGLLSLYQRAQRYECVLILGFIGLSLVAPLVHNVALRHIAIIAPLMYLVAGIGIIHLSDVVMKTRSKAGWTGIMIPGMSLVAVVGAFFMPLRKIYVYSKAYNFEYQPERITRFINAIQQFAKDHGLRDPKIVARKDYLAYYAGVEGISMPFADYDQLVTYCRLNQIDFVFLEHRWVIDFPFYDHFLTQADRPHFELLLSEVDEYGHPVELYRFQVSGSDSSLVVAGKGGLHAKP